MSFSSINLKVLIREQYHTYQAFASELNMDTAVISSRLNGRTEFRQSEIFRICRILNIKWDECDKYFFNEKVQKTEQVS